MPYRRPQIDDFNRSVPLRRDLKFGQQFLPYIQDFTRESLQKAGEDQLRNDRVSNVALAFNVLLANLHYFHHVDPDSFVTVDRSNDGYPQGEHNPLKLGSRSVRWAFNFLSGSGLIEVRGGNYDQGKKVGYTSRTRPTEALITSIDNWLEHQENNPNGINQPIIRNTLQNNPTSPLVAQLYDRAGLPSIRLKDADKKPVAFLPTAETLRMGENLRRINEYLQEQWVDLLQAEYDGRENLGDVEGDEGRVRSMERAFSRTLYRVFNNGSFADGGRFFGGWWQVVPPELRRWITINGYPTAELDFSNMQIAMLYAEEGQPLEGDAYTLPGIDPMYRPLIKKTLLSIINAEGRIAAPSKDQLPPDISFNQLRGALEEKHRSIAAHFGTGVGIRLQRRESDIAETVMLTMMEMRLPVLPIHDSFLVELGQQDVLRRVMTEAWEAHGRNAIDIKADPSWLDHLFESNPHAQEMDAVGAKSIEEFWTELEARPEFHSYRERRAHFLAGRSEEYIRQRRFFGY